MSDKGYNMSNNKYQVLIVEDEPAIAEGLVDICIFKGYEAIHCADGESGLEAALSGRFDLVILDIMLPKMDGFTVCNKIRDVNRELPIIILSAKTSEGDIVEGLKLGADDYVNKPFSIAQLFARMEAVLRRSKKTIDAENHLKLGELVIHFREYSGTRGLEQFPFTRKEIEILEYLNKNHDVVVSRQDLLREVWGYENADTVDTRTVDIHITKLRKKIEVNPAVPRYLITLRGQGYQLRTGLEG
tara:strand:+ start:143 stop:874 length:732 start_codon:yes stop_codon:yes gene_type:complete